MTSPREYREFALECGKQAIATTDEQLRKVLLSAARLWMDTALQVEKSWTLMDDQEPVTVKNKRR
jgi:hypothetical protein